MICETKSDISQPFIGRVSEIVQRVGGPNDFNQLADAILLQRVLPGQAIVPYGMARVEYSDEWLVFAPAVRQCHFDYARFLLICRPGSPLYN